ncbi:MAG: DUF3307 domain-containing protein [Clostridia bacterium]|nr:DUF3307 domain-containing protein [Clostridia bacterium]
MPNTLIIILVLLGHIVGDFYAQTNKMARRKDKIWEELLLHGIAYALCMRAVLFIGISPSRQLIWIAVFLGAIHFLIDSIKFFLLPLIKDIFKPDNPGKVKGWVFIIDQCAHLLSMAAILWFWGPQLETKQFVSHEIIIEQSPVPALIVLFGILCVLKPVGMLFERGAILKPFEQKPAGQKGKLAGNSVQIAIDNGSENVDDENTDKIIDHNASKTIGYLERLVVFLFLLYKQYGAIAFVLTAKSVARFPETKTKEKAEYFLIGTLFSVASAFIIAFLLGLCG